VPAGSPAPSEDQLLPLMPPEEVHALRRWTPPELMARAVKPAQRDFRTATLDAVLPGRGWMLAPVIGFGLSQHRDHRPAVSEPQGFSVEWIQLPPGQRSAAFTLDEVAVLVHAQGPLIVAFNDGDASVSAPLGAWDTLSIPAGTLRQFINTGTEPAYALLIVNGDAPKRPQFDAAVHAQAEALDMALDAGGHLARKSLLPPLMGV